MLVVLQKYGRGNECNAECTAQWMKKSYVSLLISVLKLDQRCTNLL